MEFSTKLLLLFILFCTSQNNAEDDASVYTPKNFCVRLTTNHTALLQWVEPVTLRSEIRGYTVYYTRDAELPLEKWTTVKIGNNPLLTIRPIELEQIYHFRVQVDTLGLEQAGPISDVFDFKMLNRTRSCYDHEKTSTIKSLNVLRAAATSNSSVEVWWNFAHDPHHVTGFKVFYGNNESDHWNYKEVGLTQSAELSNLKEAATYQIALAAVTHSGLEYYSQDTTVKVQPEEVPMDVQLSDVTPHSIHLKWSPPTLLNPIKYKIAYDAVKNFVDSLGIHQNFRIEKTEKIVDGHVTQYVLQDLLPYTNYKVNISAIPVDYSYRPSTKITARTEMAAPPPMVKPDLLRIINGGNVQLVLPQASEEYGPVGYYYVIVVPQTDEDVHMPSSVYATEELLDNEWQQGEEVNAPYIAAKFSKKIPFAFILGTGHQGEFKNHKLDSNKKYRVFIRAVVATPQEDLFTDSPFSDYFSTDVRKQVGN